MISTWICLYLLIVGKSTTSFLNGGGKVKQKQMQSLQLFGNIQLNCVNNRLSHVYQAAKMLSTDSADIATELKCRLKLTDRFDRWRYLQKLLDSEASPEDVSLILLVVLNQYFQTPEIDKNGNPKVPEITGSQYSIIAELTRNDDWKRVRDLLELNDDGEAGMQHEVFSQLENLLPDPLVDEDAHKGLWDTIIEIHGRESVKINERISSREWKVQCLVARLLIHFDFLSLGIL